MSGEPNFFCRSEKLDSKSFILEQSKFLKEVSNPVSESSSTKASPFSCSKSRITVSAPAKAKAVDTSRPINPKPPTTKAVF